MNTNTQALREALEPFAKLFQALQSKHDGPMPTTFEAIISTEDVRRAAYAFAALSHPPAPEQASGELPPLPEGKAVVRGPVAAFKDPEYGTLVDFDCEGPISHDPEDGEELFTADQMRDYARTAVLSKAPYAAAVKDAPNGLLKRAVDLHEKAGMPWAEAEELALSEAGIEDSHIDELTWNTEHATIVTLLSEEEVREFTRTILIYGQPLLSASPAAPEAAKPDNWQQYAQDGENAQQCIERHRKEQDALLTLLANARRPYSDNEEMKL